MRPFCELRSPTPPKIKRKEQNLNKKDTCRIYLILTVWIKVRKLSQHWIRLIFNILEHSIAKRMFHVMLTNFKDILKYDSIQYLDQSNTITEVKGWINYIEHFLFGVKQ